MRRWLVVSLGLLSSMGQLRAQPTSGLLPKVGLTLLPRSTATVHTTTLDLTSNLRAAWLAATTEPAKPDSEAVTKCTASRHIAVVVELLSATVGPAHTFLQVQLIGFADEVTVRLLNNLGRVVRRQRSRPPLLLAMQSLEPGHYFLLVTDTAGQLLADCQCVVIEP